MSASSQPSVSRAAEFAGILRGRLENLPIKFIAVELAYDESHIGKFLRGSAALTLSHVEKLLRLAKLKAVDESKTCIDPGLLRYLRKVESRAQDHAPWLCNDET